MKRSVVVALVFTLLLTVLAGCAGNQPPTLTAVTKDGQTFDSKKVTIEIKSEDKDLPTGKKLKYSWNFGDGKKQEKEDVAGSVKMDYIYAKQGDYIVKVVATDDKGAKSEERSIKIKVQNAKPTAVATANPTKGPASLKVSFDGGGSKDSDGQITKYEWDFGDGTPKVTGAKVEHTYNEPKTYNVTLTVTDDEGTTATVKLTITVELASFSMNLTPTAVTVKQGATIPLTVNVTRVGGLTEPVQLTMEGAPAGVTAVFDPNPAPANTSTLTLVVDAALIPGSYAVHVRGTGGGISKTADFILTVFTKESVAITFPPQALETLPEWERVEQIRDWIVYAFLTAREVPPDRITVALHNQPPLRTPALSEVHTWQYGIGRWVWLDDDPKDGSIGDLYAFLPKGADQRLLGGLADEFRRTTGQIPTFVHHVEYTLDERTGTASFVLSNTLEGKQLFTVGGPFGYYERDIRTRTDLVEFLGQVDDLGYAKLEGSVLRLGGRDLSSWDPMMSVEDVAALYQAYLKTSDVGFSLDPEPPGISEEIVFFIRTFLPDLPEKYVPYVALWLELPDELPADIVSPSEWEEVQGSVRSGQLLLLHQVMKRFLTKGTADARKVYDNVTSLLRIYVAQCARYDGDIKGTKVGMTLFYSDLLMKLWFWDFENSTPRDIGMIPVLEFPISSAHWRGIWEFPEGRRWLGANPSQIGKSPTSLLFSPMITRIFAAADDPDNPGKEVELSKLPERMRITNQWWEAHWPEIMDYEPEYFRLNQLMKFSAVMAWLLNAGRMQVLAFLEREPVVRTHDFEQWLKANRDHLTFKDWLPFVGKSDKGTECLSMISSEARPAFGGQAAFLSGGITLTGQKELAKSLDTVDFIKQVTSMGKITSGKEATYTWSTPSAVTVTPGADASFRTPALILSRIQEVKDSWQRTPNTYKYSSVWKLVTNQSLDTQVILERTAEGVIKVEAIGSALVVEHLAQALSGRLEMPEYVQEMYYDPTTRGMFIETTYGWFQAAAPQSLPEDLLLGGSPVTSYIPAVQPLAAPPSIEKKWAVNLADIRNRVDSWKEAEAGCLIAALGEFYYVVTTRGPAVYYTFSANSELARALRGEVVSWPTSPQDVNWWWAFEEFVDHFFSKLPKPIKWDIKGTKVILFTPGGRRPVIDVPVEIKNNIDKWLEVKPLETGLEIEFLEKRHA